MNKRTLLFQGDEITTANYNNMSEKNGYVHLIEEKMSGYNVLNMAEDGIDTFVMYSRWDERGMDYLPDVFTIMIGKNDISEAAKLPCGETARRYTVLIDAAIREARRIKPDIQLIFIEPFIVVSDEMTENEKLMKSEMTKLQNELERMVKKYECGYIKTQEYFDLNRETVSDKFFPDASGQRFIADMWLKCFADAESGRERKPRP